MFLINGQNSEHLPVQDRGLHYGDGVFETIAVHEKGPLCWESHYHRLKSGCNRLGIACPDSSLLLSEFAGFRINSDPVVLKIIITRGQGGRGYRPPAPDTPATRILGIYPWPDYPEKNYIQGVSIKTCQTRLGNNALLAGIKHLNRLEQVLARSEWDNPEIAEGLMLDINDNVIEGTMSNLFIIRNQTLFTPDLSQCGINGIVREHILAQTPEIGLPVKITEIKLSELNSADEIFLCNSVIGIWAVETIDSQPCKSGPWIQKIRNQLTEKKIIVR